MLNYFTSSYTDLAKGIDSKSTPNLIPDGFSQELVNVDVSSEGHVRTRKGYQGYYGWIPLRVQEVQYNSDPTNNIILTLDAAVDLSLVTPGPVMVHGKLNDSTMSGDFTTTDSTHWYSTYTVNQPVTFPFTGSSATESYSSAETGIAGNQIAVGMTLSTSSTDLSNSTVFADSISVNAISFQTDVTYTNTSGADLDAYIFFKDKADVAGEVYSQDFGTPVGVTSVSITAATHGLNHNQIIAKVEELVTGVYTEVIPDTLTINTSTGQVDVTFSVATTGRIILTAPDILNIATEAVAAGETKTKSISSPGSEFNFVSCYLVSGTTAEQVLPDSISYDATTDTLSITVTNSGLSAVTLEIYYENATIQNNAIKVTGTVTVTGTDTEPQMVVWGIPHADIYNSTAVAGGYVNYLDNYKSSTEDRLVTTLGGNLYKAYSASEIGITYAPTYYLNLSNRANGAQMLAPTFQTTGASVARARGTIEGSDISGNKAVVTTAAYNSGTTYTDYTLSITGMNPLDSSLVSQAYTYVSTIISTTSSLEDYITITDMNHSRLNGTFKIKSVASTASTITLSVINSNITNADYDAANCNGRGAIYTDRVALTSTSTFAANDELNSDSISTLYTVLVTGSSGSNISVNGVTGTISLASNVRIYGSRTSATFPLKSYAGTATIDNLVVGDMLTVTGYNRKLRITAMSEADHTVTLDESITLTDTTASTVSLRPVGRWYPVELPVSTGTLTPSTQVTHFDANDPSDQDYMQGALINDSLFITDYANEIMKFDGTNIYRAGLFRWQPQMFANVLTATTSFSPVTSAIPGGGVTGNRFTVDAGQIALFTSGMLVYHTQNGVYYNVVSTDITNNYVYVDINITGSDSGTLNIVQEYRYYFRLNAIDANNNIVASAATGSEDFRVRLGVAGQIQLKLVGMPAFDLYDYDRIECQIYRTKQNLQTPFYLIGSVPVTFSRADAYILFNDGIIDDALTTGDLDSTMSALLGNELGVNWAEPVRAKYLTTAANRLIAANVKDYPKLDIVVKKLSTDVSFTSADLLAANETKWLFRKDNADTTTTTNMVDRVKYEFVGTGGAVTLVPDPANPATCSFTASAGVSFTIDTKAVAHGLLAGDWVYLYHSTAAADNDLTFAGWFQIYSVTSGGTNTFTIKYTKARTSTTNDVDRYVTATAQEDVPVLLGTDGNYNQKDGNSATLPYGSIAMLRLAQAINASMTMTDTTITGFTTFKPWITANSGLEFGSGRLIVTQPKVFSSTMELVLDSAAGTSYNVFVNDIKRTASEQVGAATRVYPSRVIISYENYPEIFDGPIDGGTSVFDVNPADGQEITQVIPFFAESVFGSGTKEAIVVVFKSDSIYVLSTATGAVQKLDSQGLGCTYPRSVGHTKNGIIFANRSGVYKLRYDYTVAYVGKAADGLWKDTVNRDRTIEIVGHQHALEQRYYISVPYDSDTVPDNVLVYDYNRETADESGAWTSYSNMPVTYWVEADNDVYFSTRDGQVYSLRRAGDETDYRDDASAVAAISVITQPYTFGSHGIRHNIREFITKLKIENDITNLAISTSSDLSTTFTTANTVSITEGSSGVYTNRSVIPVRSTPAYSKLLYLQLKFSHSTKDECVVICGLDFTAAPLTSKGIQQPGSTGAITS